MPIPLRCDRTPHVGLRHRATEAFNIERGVQCLSRHWLARNVELSTSSRRATSATRCFGPLEVRYDHGSLDADSAKRRIQAGPQNLWRYADFLPFAQPPKYALPAGCTPLVRAPRLAEALGLRDVWVKNDAANPTHSFKDRVVSVALAKAQELGYTDGGLRLDRQPGQRRGRARRGRRARLVRVHPGRPRGAEDPRHGRLRHQARDRARQLRRRQPALHRAVGRPRLGVRERERAALLRRGLEDARLRDRRGARLRAARPRGRAGRVGLAVHQDRARLRRVARGRADRRRDADDERRPGRGLLAGRAGVRRRLGHLQAGEAGHDRQVARDRQPGRRALRARAGAPQRRHRSTRSPTTRSAPASACWPRRPASSPRPPAA